MSRRRRMKAGSNPGVRTIGVMPARSAAITQACTSCRSRLVCSMSIKAASNPASPMISTICGSGMPPTWVPRASPPPLMIRLTRFSCMASSQLRSSAEFSSHPPTPAARAPPSPACGGGLGWGLGPLTRMLADECFHPLDRRAGVGGVRLAGHEAVTRAGVELQFDLAAGVSPPLDQALHGFERDPLVIVAAEGEGGRQGDLLAAVEDRRWAALTHRRLIAPEGVVVLDQLGIPGLLGQVVAQQRVKHAPARNHEGDAGVDSPHPT